MRRGLFLIAALTLAAAATAALARPPVVVELFTAQGCSSCGKANGYVGALAADKGVLPLTYGVDYWDYLGWKDTFARPEFTERQRAYAKRLGVAEVYTPQVVVDGRVQTAGVRSETIEKLVREARRVVPNPPDANFRDDRIAVGGGRGPRGGAEVWLVRFDPRDQAVEVKDGDNRGQTVTEKNVVMQLEKLGAWKGRPVRFKLPPTPAEGLATLVLLQERDGGRIVGAWLKGN